jgi:hypothetical protein
MQFKLNFDRYSAAWSDESEQYYNFGDSTRMSREPSHLRYRARNRRPRHAFDRMGFFY